jgi:Uma2 family endonuclease
MAALIEMLDEYYSAQQRVYVSGNLLIFYQPGNRRKHVSPDVFVVKGVQKRQRPNYLLWEEKRSPQVVIELTSSSTRNEDTDTKKLLYQNTLKVREYFLFDPDGDYLDPPLQGFRLRGGVYRPIRAVNGRLPSQTLGLHLQRDGRILRLWDPGTGQFLLMPREARETAERLASEALRRADQAERSLQQAEARIAALEAELARLRPNEPP